MQTLRTELIETQKARTDLMKWKLLIVAGIGGAALGLSGTVGSPNSSLALAVIPLACVYVDLLCRHYSLRNKAIGAFIAHGEHKNDELRKYELFYYDMARKAWSGVSLESVALIGCTLVLSIAIVPVGILASGEALWPLRAPWPASLFIASGAAGIILSLLLQARYVRAKAAAEMVIKESAALFTTRTPARSDA